MGVNHRLREAEIHQLALGADIHLAHHGQPIDFRLERTQAVGQFLWQHGNDMARKINRSATLDRLFIQCTIGFDVVRDIGDGDH